MRRRALRALQPRLAAEAQDRSTTKLPSILSQPLSPWLRKASDAIKVCDAVKRWRESRLTNKRKSEAVKRVKARRSHTLLLFHCIQLFGVIALSATGSSRWRECDRVSTG